MPRAEQSEVLTEDVQYAERQVELLKQSCGTLSKKIGSLLSRKKNIKLLSNVVNNYNILLFIQEMKEYNLISA